MTVRLMSDGSAGISEQQGVFANGEEASMVLLDDIPFFSRGNWVTGLTISVGTMVVLPLVAPILRPLAKAAIKGGLQAYQGATGWVGDLVAEAVAEGGRKVAEEALEEAATAAGWRDHRPAASEKRPPSSGRGPWRYCRSKGRIVPS